MLQGSLVPYKKDNMGYAWAEKNQSQARSYAKIVTRKFPLVL